jgi:hypothetical protein
MQAGAPDFTLWAVRKGDWIATARQRHAPGGVELRFLVDGDLVYSQLFRDEANCARWPTRSCRNFATAAGGEDA